MTYTGDEYVGIDEDAVADDEPLDTYVENAIRNNVSAVRGLGHQVSWAPRSYDSDDHSQALRIRPYASYARSSILSVPWIVQDGQSTTSFSIHHRTADEHGTGDGVFAWASLVGVAETRFSVASTDGSTPEWAIREVDLDLAEPFSGEIHTDLRIEQRGDSPGTTILQSVVSHEVTKAGGLISASGAANELLRHNGAAYPDSDDKHTMVFENQGESLQLYDILWTSSSQNKGAVRPAFTGAVDTPTDTARIRPLSYIQVRGVEVHSTWEGDTDLRPQARYHPHLIVDARDEVSHPLSIDRAYRRKRCLWIGPRGTLGDTELGWYTGYGPKHARVRGNASAQVLFPASIVPRTRSPKILVLLNVLTTYAPSVSGGIIENTTSTDALAEASGEVTWTIEAAVTRYADGTSTPTSVASSDIDVELTCFPHLATPLYPALQTELLYYAQAEGFQDEWPYKEGQLFQEDHGLIQRVALEIDLSSHNPTTNLDPYTVTVSALVDSIGNFPVTESVVANDFTMTVTGATIWEVPQ